jgi:adenylate kinase family enzyme
MKNLSVSARKSENYTLIISIQGDGQDIVKQYNKCCKTDWSPTYEERIQQGMLLYKAVFHDEVETQFYELLRSAKNSRTKMRLMFEIKEPTVNTMDWGLLYDPHNYRFLIEDDCIEIYHRRDDIPRIGVTSLSAPLKVAFIHLGLSAKEAEHLELWVNNELSSLVETGSLKLSSHTGIKLSAGDLNALRDIEIFHLVIKSSDRKLLSQAKKSHGAARIGKKDVKENPWDNLRAALGVNSRGMLSFINKKPVVPDDRIIDCLQSKGWPLFCRSDIFYFDRQESQCLRDIYFAIVSYDVNHLNLNWVLQRQLAMDLRNTPRLRKYQLFTFGDTFFQDQAKIDRTQETNLKKYLRSAIYSVERFYQWEKLYAELMFSTRLRLQKLDLKDVEDVCELEERIYKLEEALQEFDKLIIIGEPGTGKTTACQRATWQLSKLAFQQLNANQPNIKPQIPLYIPLKSLSASITSENLTLFEHIANALFEQLPELEAQRTALKEFLKSYNLILLLDGLNEVSPFSLRNRLIAEILKIREDYVSGTSAIRIVVTSRKHNLDIARFISEGEFKVLEIVELSPSDIRTFAECYLPSDKSTDTFLECLNPKLLTAARNPLMLRLLLSDFMEGKTLIGSRAQLLHNFCHRCLYNPCDVLEHTIPQQVRLKELVLTNVAYQCWKRDASLSISLVEACGYAMECGLDKETAEKLFDELAQNGILYKNIDDHGHEHLEFRYQSYHEYYCAMKVAEIWRKAKTNKFKRLCQQEEWHEIIALSAGVIEMENNDSSDNIQKRPEINLINYLKGRRQMILAGMCIWNMESMNKQLKDFETWIINRANSACTILTKISIFTLFYFIMPVWVTTLFLTMTYTNNHDFYIWSYGRFTLGTSTIACIVIYTVVPFILYGF